MTIDDIRKKYLYYENLNDYAYDYINKYSSDENKKNDVEEAKEVYELTNEILLRLNIRRNKIENSKNINALYLNMIEYYADCNSKKSLDKIINSPISAISGQEMFNAIEIVNEQIKESEKIVERYKKNCIDLNNKIDLLKKKNINIKEIKKQLSEFKKRFYIPNLRKLCKLRKEVYIYNQYIADLSSLRMQSVYASKIVEYDNLASAIDSENAIVNFYLDSEKNNEMINRKLKNISNMKRKQDEIKAELESFNGYKMDLNTAKNIDKIFSDTKELTEINISKISENELEMYNNKLKNNNEIVKQGNEYFDAKKQLKDEIINQMLKLGLNTERLITDYDIIEKVDSNKFEYSSSNIRNEKTRIERLIENNKNKFDELSIKLENIGSINSEDLNKIFNAALKFKNMNKEDKVDYKKENKENKENNNKVVNNNFVETDEQIEARRKQKLKEMFKDYHMNDEVLTNIEKNGLSYILKSDKEKKLKEQEDYKKNSRLKKKKILEEARKTLENVNNLENIQNIEEDNISHHRRAA